MSEPTKAVFLSYASQDAETAKRICDALRQVGIEVWFDQSELRGGDAWDAKIKKQIKECALFVPIISANTQARAEGYFRLEWKLAVDRSHLMADDAPFLFPIVIGDVADATARVPDKFRDVQWTRLTVKDTPESLAVRVGKLLGGGPPEDRGQKAEDRTGRTKSRPTWLRYGWAGVGIVFALVYAVRPMWQSVHRPEPKPSAASVPVQPAPPQLSEARQLAQRAMAMSVDKYNSTADDYATAEGLLKRALELEQNDAEIWAISSMLHTNIRTRGFDHAPVRREWARRDAERAVKLGPDSQNALFALGRAQRDTDPVAAEGTFKKLLFLNPENADAMGQLGWLYDNDGRIGEASKLYDRVLVLDPANAPLTHYVRFLLFFHYSRFAEAEQAIRRSVEMEPSANSSAGLVMLLLTAKGDAEESARVLAAVPAAFRNEPRIVWVEAMAQLCRRDPEAALRALQRLQNDYIQDNWFAGPKAYFAGLAHTMAGRAEAARVAWQSALAIVDTRLKETPDNPILRLCRGQLLAWLGQTDEARREARLLDEMRAGRPTRSWFGSTALIHAAVGDADKAMPLLEQLMSVDNSTNVGWPLTRTLLRLDPRWDKLRADPRFQKLCEEPAAVLTEDRGQKTEVSVPIDQKSVAVLAFANLSDDKANEYFSDGISEELLNMLAKIPGLKVSARTSAFYFKGKQVPMAEIAQQLGVAYVVEGSVRKAGGKVRITTQLIKAADGFHVWSDTFTRDLKDIFAVQDEIAGLIAKNLQLKMGIGTSGVRHNVAPDAYEEFLTGRALAAAGSVTAMKESIARFRRAVEIDPEFTAAWVQVARSYVHLSRWGGLLSPAEWDETRQAVARAIELEPASPDVLLALGWVRRTADWNWKGAEQAMREALRLRPDHAETLASLAVLLANLSREQEAIVMAQRAVALDPLNASVQMDLLVIFYCYGRYPEAVQAGRRAAELAPGSSIVRSWLARSLIELNRFDEAEAEINRENNWFSRTGALARLRAKQGRLAEARSLLGEMEARAEQIGGAENSFAYIANVWGIVGDAKRGMDFFEKTRAIRDPSIAWARTSFYAACLGRDPRWPDFLRSVGLADDQLK